MTDPVFRKVVCRSLLFAALTSVMLPVAFAGEDASAPPGEPELNQRIEHVMAGLSGPVVIAGRPGMQLADRMKRLRIPGVSIAVIHDGHIEWARGFGVAAVGGSPVTPETLFQAGSISKPVSAAAVLALVQAGKLDLDRDVDSYLKGWKLPANAWTGKATVTLRELLSHSAGTTVHGFGGYAGGAPVPSLAEVLNGAPPANSPAVVVDIEPGTQFRYSGGGYTIIQQLLIDVTDRPFAAFLDETVLGPLALTHSSFHQPLTEPEQHVAATPYLPSGQPVPGGAHIYPELAAAGLWTTPSDLARFAMALQDALAGRPAILSQATIREMLTPRFDHFGLGLIVGGSPEKRYFTHDGVDAGFEALMVAYESGDGAVVMTNAVGGGRLAAEIMRSIAAEYHWPDWHPVERKLAVVDPKLFDLYAGRYELGPDSILTVSRAGDRLYVQLTGQPNFQVFPEADRDYFYTIVNAQITFVVGDQGHVTELILHQNGDHHARRIE
jgi:CubicO group peptidase (beta-lactamase class C family)